MQLSNAISDGCVAATSLFVFFRFCANLPFYNKILWGTFLATVIMAACAGVCRFLGMNQLIPLHNSLTMLGRTLGIASLLASIWVTVTQTTASRTLLIGSVVVGLVSFVAMLYPSLRPFAQVIESIGILGGMLFAVWGLIKKYQKSGWIILGIMVMALATKVVGRHLPISPVDVYHYALVAMVYCFGRAV